MQAVAERSQIGLTPKAKAEKREGQKEKILAMLTEAGVYGLTSEALNKVAFRYAAVIHKLRKDGWVISTDGRKATELVRYTLRGRIEPGQIPLL